MIVTRPIHLACLLLLGAAITLAAAEPEVSLTVEPLPLVVGGEGLVILKSSQGIPEIDAFPALDGLEWSEGRNVMQQTINGRATYMTQYGIRATRAGDLTLPPLTVNVNGQRVGLEQTPLTARQDSNFTLSLRYDGQEEPPASLYVDQELTLDVDLLIAADDVELPRLFFTDLQRFLPRLDLQNVAVRPYEYAPGRHVPFSWEEDSTTLQGRRYTRIRYRSAVWPNGTAPVSGQVVHYVPHTVTSYDRLIQFSRVVYRKLQVSVPSITVKPLPAPDQPGSLNLGLVGDWDLDFTLNHNTARLGEDLELRLTASGHGHVESGVAPALDLPGFTVYEPEITRTSGETDQFDVRWVIIPIRRDARLPALSFLTFDPQAGAYRSQRFQPTLTLVDDQGQVIPPPVTPPAPARPDTAAAPSAPPATAHPEPDLRPLKPLAAAGGLGPATLSRTLALGLAVIGTLAFVILRRRIRRQEALAADPALRRREAARARAAQLLARLQTAPDAALLQAIRDDLQPWLADLRCLPPGLTLGELADRLDDPELAALLRQAEAASFQPAAAVGIDRAALLRRLRAVLTAALLLLPLATYAVSPSDGASAQAAPEAHYRAGHFAAAAEGFRAAIQARPDDPHAWYDLGNCAFQTGDLGAALGAYERAWRLAPRDPDIAMNRQLTRQRLGLPVHVGGGWRASLLSLRDQLAPWDWELAAGLAWFSACLLGGMARRRRLVLLGALLLVVLGGMALGASLWQRQGPWRSGSAVVIRATPLAELPPPAADDAEHPPTGFQTLNVGRELLVLEERDGGALRVQIGPTEGWLRRRDIQITWP